MSSRGLLNIFMTLAVVVAAGMAYLHRPDDGPSPQTYPLVPIAQPDIRTIEIERAKSPAIALQRVEGVWHMAMPVKARLDETALARVLDLSRLSATSRLSPDDLVRYGLDKPWAKVRFGSHLLTFGNTNTVTEELYVQSGDAVYAVSARSATAIPSMPGRLIAHRMFSPAETPVAITLRGFRIRHDGTRWQLDPPNRELSQDDLIRWIEQWRYASSVLTQPGAPGAAADVIVDLSDGRRIEFAVKARAPDLVLHRRDEGLDYHFNAGMASMLLAAPSSATAAKP